MVLAIWVCCTNYTVWGSLIVFLSKKYMLFYIIFGTNLLTGGLVPVSVFFAYFRVSQKRNIKQSPNGMKPSRALFLEQKQSRRLGVDVRVASRKPRGRRARPTPWARPPLSWGPRGSPGRLLSPIYVHIP